MNFNIKKISLVLLGIVLGLVFIEMLLSLTFGTSLGIRRKSVDSPHFLDYNLNTGSVQQINETIFIMGEDLKRSDFNLDMWENIEDEDIIWHEDGSERLCRNKGKGYFILLIGDSVTAGGGLEFKKGSFENSFNKKLEYNLNLSYPNRFKVDTLAQGGYNLIQIERMYREFLKSCVPDAVIYNFFQNDLNTNYLIKGNDGRLAIAYELTGHSPFMSGKIGRFLRNSKLFLLIDSAIYSILYKEIFEDTIDESNIDTKFESYHKQSILRYPRQEESLQRMMRVSKENNITFIVVNHPYLLKGYPTTNYLYYMQKKFGFNLIDLRVIYMQKGLKYEKLITNITAYDNAHLSIYGHAKVADILYDELIKSGLLPTG